jgi:diaminopimelate epimerase
MKFSKYHALGNDYLVIHPQDAGDLAQQPERIQRICHRNYGIGADGVLIGPFLSSEADFNLRIFNPDGSEAEKSGNGIRIFSRWLWDQGLVHHHHFTIKVSGGIVSVQIAKDGKMIEIVMGKVSFDSQRIPVAGPPREVLRETMEVNGKTLLYCAATIGNPHCIILCDSISTEQVKTLGPLIEKEPRFPNRTNVQFMQIINRKNIAIEIWERGAGYTLASGSSSCAAAATANRLGFCEAEITVHMPGGNLIIEIDKQAEVHMRGPVTFIAEGELSNEMFSDKI